MTVNLALMCKSHNYSKTGNTFRVGNWVISQARRKELIGGTVALTESQSSPAYLGGTIIDFLPTVDGKCEVVFKEDPGVEGNVDAVQHRGWGSGRGVCYV